MSKTNTFSNSAFEFSLTAELQKRLDSYGPSVVSEKNKTYYRLALAYGRLLPWQEVDYDNAASVVADVITRMASNIFRAQSDRYTFSHPIVMFGSNTDKRDIVIDDNNGVNIGINIGNYPSAWLERPFLYDVETDNHNIVDIGKEWFESKGISVDYENELGAIRNLLSEIEGKAWSDAFPDNETKFQKLYYPLLNAVIDETKRQCVNSESVRLFIKKVFGPNDYYLVMINSQAKRARVSAYEINGQLGQGQNYIDELLPTKLIRVGYKERANSIANSKISLLFDRGWNVNIRVKQEGSSVRAQGPRLEIDFNGSNPHNLIQDEVRWK